MDCSCGGALIEGRSCYRVSKENFVYIIENLPAFKCTRCDKILFSDAVVDRIQKLTIRIERETTEIITGKPSVNSYDY